jgi:hypothetical protein
LAGETGFVYPCQDVEALARLLQNAAADRDNLARMGGAARSRMATWSPRENIQATVDAVAAALSRGKARPLPAAPLHQVSGIGQGTTGKLPE